MRWRERRRSSNVEDRRGIPTRGLAVGGGLGTVVLLLLAVVMGVDPRELVQPMPPGGVPGEQRATNPVEDELAEFVSVVLADTEDVWHKLFSEKGRQYRDAKLVLFTEQVQSACGFASAAVGPFYCPGDGTVYIDLQFYDQLKRQFGAPGDFAQAYVIAHEIGHHVQNQLGITEEVDAQRGRLSKEQFNQLSVRLELQADFFAGVWAHHAERMQQLLEEGDIEEAIDAASAIGDDRLQRETQGYVVPDSFTHGTSEQRVRWFRRGFQAGDMDQGDTFNAASL